MTQAGSTRKTGREDRASSSWRDEVASWLELTRHRTLDLVAPLSDDVLETPVRDYMSPLVWDLCHIANFEELWLVDALEGRGEARLAPRFDALATPRSDRGRIGLPGKAEACRYLDTVRTRTLGQLEAADPASRDPLLRDGYVYRMVIQHEGQHQETMLQSLNLLAGERRDLVVGGGRMPTSVDGKPTDSVDDELRVRVEGGPFLMGTDDRTRAYDNERACHEISIAGFDIERYPVTNRRWAAFMEDQGYERPELWSAEGNAWRTAAGRQRHPLGWTADASGFRVSCFGRDLPLLPDMPVQHVCYWEAEAFARWCGGRLPTEAEWEKAASWGPAAAVPRARPREAAGPAEVGVRWACGTNAGEASMESGQGGTWGPERIGRRPELASAYGVEDMLGTVYAWTSSAFHAYPGFTPFPYSGYSEVFFGDTYRVLRGASWASHPLLWRNSYRNWDLPHRRQIFAGVRVAYDC